MSAVRRSLDPFLRDLETMGTLRQLQDVAQLDYIAKRIVDDRIHDGIQRGLRAFPEPLAHAAAPYRIDATVGESP